MSDGSASPRPQWIATFGDPATWATLSPQATYRAPGEGEPTLSGHATLSGPATTISGAGTVVGAVETLSGGATLSGASWAAPGASAGTATFDMLGEVGRGGMGVVYRARQRALGREVALKFIRPEQRSPQAQARFIAEALVNGVLDHPNIVPVHDLGHAGGEVFLAMKLIGGRSWRELLHAPGAPAGPAGDIERHLAILDSVGNAVAFAHSKGIVHRDLKPENVMVGDFGEVLVMDWGIAVDIRDQPGDDRRAQHRSTIRSPAGTPIYMPSELADGRGDDIGPWTDTALLGAILHEILTGAPPWRGGSLVEVLMAASRGELADFPAAAPSGLAAICRRSLARDHRQRYGSVAEFQAAIRDWRRNRESERIAEVAAVALARAQAGAGDDDAARRRRYGACTEAVAGFRQALALWTGNAAAQAGERQARLAYARAALSGGDLGLADAELAQVPADDAAANELRAAVAAARHDAQRRARSARMLRRTTAALVAAIVVGVGVAFLIIRGERNDALAAHAQAAAAHRAAVAQHALAEARRGEAERAHAAEQAQRAAAESQKAEAQRQRDEAQRQSRTAARRLAQAQVAQGDGLAQAGRWNEAKAQYHEAIGGFAALGEPTLPGDLGLFDAHRHAPPPLVSIAHGAAAHAVAWLPDGRHLLAAGGNGSLALYDAPSGRRVRGFTGHQGVVYAVAVLGAGAQALSAGADRSMRLWDVASGRELRAWTGFAGMVWDVAVSPDGGRALTADLSGALRRWNLADGAELPALAASLQLPRSVAWSSDGAFAVSGSTGTRTLRRWNLATGDEAHSFAEVGTLWGVAISPDGSQALSGGEDRVLRLWNAATGQQLKELHGHGEGIQAVRFAPDGASLASASRDLTCRIWDLPSGRERLACTGSTDYPLALAFAPDGSRLAVAARDGQVRVWPTVAHPEVRALRGHLGWPSPCAAFTPDGRLVLSAGGDGLRLWDVATARCLRRIGGQPSAPAHRLAIAADGRTAVVGGANQPLLVLDLRTGERRREIAGELRALSADARWALLALPGSTLHVVEVATGTVAHRLSGAPTADCWALSPDGGTVFAGRHQLISGWRLAMPAAHRLAGIPQLMPAATTKATTLSYLSYPGTPVALAVSDDGQRLLAVGRARELMQWEVGSQRVLSTGVSSSFVTWSATFFPDGRNVLAGHVADSMSLWDAEAGRELRTFAANPGGVLRVAVSTDGHRALSSGKDGSLLLWDFASAAAHRRLAEGLPDALATLRERPDDAGALAALARWQGFRGQWTWAIDLATRARAAGAVIAPLDLARWHWQRGDYAQARSELAAASAAGAETPDYLELCRQAIEADAAAR